MADKEKRALFGASSAHWGIGIALGMGVGIAMGAALGDIAIGISLGAAFGIMAALLMGEMRKERDEDSR